MAQLNKEQIKNLFNQLNNIWIVEIVESEKGCGRSTEITYYDDETDAMNAYEEVNKHNKAGGPVPDYYIIARKPVTFAKYFRFVI